MAAEEVKKCNHEGDYKSSGIVTMNEPDALVIFVVLFCEKCGEAMAKNIRIKKIQVSEAKLPVVSGIGRKGN